MKKLLILLLLFLGTIAEAHDPNRNRRNGFRKRYHYDNRYDFRDHYNTYRPQYIYVTEWVPTGRYEEVWNGRCWVWEEIYRKVRKKIRVW